MGTQQSKMESTSSNQRESINAAIIPSKDKHTATIIFLHGLGDTGDGWAASLSSFGLPYLKIICPTAPAIPVTLNGRFRMPAWFDLKGLDIQSEEDVDGIKVSRDLIVNIIEQENNKGIPYERIMLGGFSQGGALSLYTSLSCKHKLAGCVALSSWLPLRNDFPGIIGTNKDSPILQCHGDSDQLVSYMYGELSYQMLQKHGCSISFKKYKSLGHSSSEQEMSDVRNFIKSQLPPV